MNSLSSAFIHYWYAGSGVIHPDLALTVDFWARFHVVKAALAAMLLLVLVPLGSRTWIVYTRAATPSRRIVVGILALLAALLALVALLVLVANLQGAIAPLSSALGLLPIAMPDPALAETITQVRRDLASDARPPVLEALVHDFTVYHLTMAGFGAVVTVGLLVTAILLWRRRARRSVAPQRGRHLQVTAVVAVMASSAFFGVVTAGNLSTAADPAPALLGFFEGGG